MLAMYIIISVLLLGLVFLTLIANAVLQVAFGKRCEGNPYIRYFEAADFEDLTAEPISFPGNRGQTLRGYLYRNEKLCSFSDLVIFVHGMGGGHTSYTTEIDFLARQGHLVLSYDQTGTMLSEGKRLYGMPQGVRDLQSALQFVAQSDSLQNLPVLLVGHSWGGYIVSRVLRYKPHVKGVAAMSGFERLNDVICDMAKQQTGMNISFLKPFLNLCGFMKFGRAALGNTSEVLLNTDVPILLLHGKADTAVRLSNSPASNTKVQAKENIEIHIYDEKQHNVYATKEAERKIAEFFGTLGEIQKKKIPEQTAESFCAGVDFRELTEEDPEVMQTLESFLQRCLQ